MSSHPDIWTELTLQYGALALSLLPGVGGRLWDVRINGNSLLFQNPDLAGCAVDLDAPGALPTRSPQFGFPLWGGEKTWIAPDRDWPDNAPHPTLDSGPYRVTEDSARSVEMVSLACPLSSLVVTRRITLTSPCSWIVHHRLRNAGTEPRAVGIWSVMMLNHATTIAVPATQPEIHPVFGSDGGMVELHKNGVIGTCGDRREFKVALRNPTGRVLMRNQASRYWVMCETPAPRGQHVYAHGMPFEIFNSGDYSYCEAEWHAPLAHLQPGSSTSFEQKFRVWSDTENSADLELATDERELMTCMF